MKSLRKILEESKLLWKDDYIEVRKKDGWYTYVHDGTGKFVAVLGFVKEPEFMILGRYEDSPPHNEGISLASLTGGLEEKENEKDGATREFGEESGIKINKEDLISLGEVRPSKFTDSVGYLFAVDLTNIVDDLDKKYMGEGDGTKGEQGAYCKFVSLEDMLKSKDPLSITCFARLKHFYLKEE